MFPPIVESYQQPQLKEGSEGCKIFFAISAYDSNVSESIKVSFVDPTTNTTIFNYENEATSSGYYTTGYDSLETNSDYKYYVTIPFSLFKAGALGLGKYYKVQLQFEGEKDWSSSTLIMFVKKPSIEIDGFEENNNSSMLTPVNPNGVNYLDQLNIKFNFIDNPDALYKIKVSIYKNLHESPTESYLYNLLEESDWTITNTYSQNIFNYKIQNLLNRNTNYYVSIEYITLNGYQDEVYALLKISNDNYKYLMGTVKVVPNNDDGMIYLNTNLKAEDGRTKTGILYIKRADYRSNFLKYETVHQVRLTYSQKLTNYFWADPTAESGVWYRYSVQFFDESTKVLYMPITTETVILNLDDIILNSNNILLKVKYNPQVSNYKYNVMESTTNTLGSKYPYVRRNGNSNYRTFSLGGLISYNADKTEDFSIISDSINTRVGSEDMSKYNSVLLTRKEAFGIAEQLFNEYNADNRVVESRDFIFERLYREKAIEFLMQDEPILFRSPTEGNILVRLSGVQLTPNQQLGRLVYSFTATATEIDACTVDNYFKYNILTEALEEVRYILDATDFDIISGDVYVTEDQVIEETKLKVTAEKYGGV